MKRTLIFTLIAVSLLAGCTDVDLSGKADSPSGSSVATAPATRIFRGEKGSQVVLGDIGVELEVSEISDGKAHFFNTSLPSGEPVYFFVVKSPDGNLRAAANGCQVCGDALQGFRQEGDYMVCNTCGNKYPLNSVSTEKGGCNPAPISANLEVIDGKVLISTSDLENVLQYF